MIDLSLDFAISLDLEVSLEPTQPRLPRLTFILVNGQVLAHVCLYLLCLLHLATIQTETVSQAQNGEVIVNGEVIHAESKQTFDEGATCGN